MRVQVVATLPEAPVPYVHIDNARYVSDPEALHRLLPRLLEDLRHTNTTINEQLDESHIVTQHEHLGVSLSHTIKGAFPSMEREGRDKR